MTEKTVCGPQKLNIYHVALYRKGLLTSGLHSKFKARGSYLWLEHMEGCCEDRPSFTVMRVEMCIKEGVRAG